jgi:hypothetical protein
MMKLKENQRREVIRTINQEFGGYRKDSESRHLLRISRMIANLNGVRWPI